MKRLLLTLLLLGAYTGAWSQLKADIIAVDVPSEMNASSNYQLDLTLKNTGTETLNRNNCTLMVSYVSGPDAEEGKKFFMEKDAYVSIYSGKEYIFKWTMEAPIVPGVYKINMALMNGSSTLAKKDATVMVEGDYATEITVNLPGFLEPEKEYAKLTGVVKNTGKAQWPVGTYQLKGEVTSSPSGASKEDKEAFEFEEDIELSNLAPGAYQAITFEEKLETPTQGGTYTIEVSVLLDGSPFDARNNTLRLDAGVQVEEQEAQITEKVTRKMHPEKEYAIDFTIENSGKLKWDKGKYAIKAKVDRAPSGMDKGIFEKTVNFEGSEMEEGDAKSVSFPEVTPPNTPGTVQVTYEILKDGKPADLEEGSLKINYEIVELLPELNIGRVTLEDDMVPGKNYKLKLDIKNYGEVMALGDDWEIKCKTRSLKPSNYKPPRGVFDISLDGIDMKAGESKYVDGSIKAPKVDKETSIRLQFDIYYKGDRMGSTKTFDIKIKP